MAEPGTDATHSDGKRFLIHQNGKTIELTYVQLFCAAHRKWHRHRYETARSIFEQLCTVTDRGPRADIFLAHCHAMLGDFAQCSAILHRALPQHTYGNAATRLHDAFVFWNVGLFVDVKNAMKALVKDYEQLPSLSLILAELLLCTGARRLSARYLRQAMQHDRRNGAVGRTAESQLKSIDDKSPTDT